MKKIVISVIMFVLMLLALQINVSASGSITPSPRSLSITKGGTGTFTITASNSCGKVTVYSSNTSVATVNLSSKWVENDSTSVTVTGVSAGTAYITIALSDAATFDEEPLSGSYTVTVTVTDPQAASSNSSSSNSSNSSSNTTTTTKPSTTTNTNNNLSTNNKIKALSVEGYELVNAGNNTYELTVTNNVKNITINASAEDSKANVSGAGNKELQNGLNTFEIVVTSESGSNNTYTINVTRKSNYNIEDLTGNISNIDENTIDVAIEKNDIISQQVLDLIKSNSKTVNFNFYNNDKILYSWIIDGASINNSIKTNTNINFTSEYVEEIGKLSNYAEGLYLDFEHSGNLPEGTKVKIYVGDKFEDGNSVNVYYYNSDNECLDTIENDLIVTDEYIEFEINHCSDYFVTRSHVADATPIPQKQSINIYMIIAIVEMAIIVILVIVNIAPIKRHKKMKS